MGLKKFPNYVKSNILSKEQNTQPMLAVSIECQSFCLYFSVKLTVLSLVQLNHRNENQNGYCQKDDQSEDILEIEQVNIFKIH